MRRLLPVLILLSGCLASADSRPNVVLMVVDDLGWSDTGIYGSTYHETPNIDALARDGVRFTTFYAASPVCSPTRASIMTGRHPARLGITDWIGGSQRGMLVPPENGSELALAEETIGESFRASGYATGFFGKWHLGDAPFLPEAQGFDVNVGGHGAGQPATYHYPYAKAGGSYWDVPGLTGGAQGEYLTDRLTDEALSWVDSVEGAPFLLVLDYYAVHTPIEGRPDLEQYFAQRVPEPAAEPFEEVAYGALNKRRQDRPDYAAMVAAVDESVGRIREHLASRGLGSNTIIVFTSDNGGLSTLADGRTTMPTSNAPLKSGKGWLYEGGIRIPLVILAPGLSVPGGESEVAGMTSDIPPTLLALAGLSPRPDQHRDGVSLRPAVQGDSAPIHDALFWHFPHYHGSGNRPSGAIRVGNLKGIEWFEDERFELYDLDADPTESQPLQQTRPSDADSLRTLLHAWRTQVGARMPTIANGDGEHD